MNAEDRLKGYSSRVDSRLADILAMGDGVPEPLVAAMRYAVLGPGKRVRPALCMACSQAVGGRPEDGLDAGCAVELVHCFSLIHDDLPALDDDRLRRGRPTVHMEFGEAAAILAGDALFALAFERLATCVGPSERVLRSVQILSWASGPEGLVGGEMADILAEGKDSSGEHVASIHQRKTAALIKAACEIGALLGGGDESEVRALAQYGARAGLAFQISDDLLNELSTTAALGKSTGSDRDRKKATYPAAFGVEESKRFAADEVRAALESLEAFDERADDLRVFARYIVERLR